MVFIVRGMQRGFARAGGKGSVYCALSSAFCTVIILHAPGCMTPWPLYREDQAKATAAAEQYNDAHG